MILLRMLVRNVALRFMGFSLVEISGPLFVIILSFLLTMTSGCKLDDDQAKGTLGSVGENNLQVVQNLNDGIYFNSLSKTPSISWDTPPAEEGVSHFLVAVGTSPGEADVYSWTRYDTNNISEISGLSLAHGSTYYVSVKKVTADGRPSKASVSDGFTVDTVPPTASVSLTDGSSFDTLGGSPWLNWSPSADDLSGLSHYEIALGSASGLTDVLDWQVIGSETSSQLAGLSLLDTQTYYPQVRAVDIAGNKSAVAIGDGWTVAKPAAQSLTVNGPVRDILTVGTTRYIAGAFTSVGTRVGRMAQVNSDGSLDSTTPWPSFNGAVKVMIDDGSGGYYVGGRFTEVGGLSRSGLARINSDGSVHSFKVDVGDTSFDVKDLYLDGTTLYVGGSFSTLGGATRAGLGAVDVVAETVLSWDPNPRRESFGYWYSGQVYSFTSDGTNLFVGGRFGEISGEARVAIASFNLSTKTLNPLSISITNSIFDVEIDDIEYHNGKLFFGGEFRDVGGATRYGAASVDSSTGVVNSWDPMFGSTSRVSKILIDGTYAYVAGAFNSMPGCVLCDDVAHVDLVNGAASPTGSGWSTAFYSPPISSTSVSVYDLVLIGSTLYVAYQNTSYGATVNVSGTCKVRPKFIMALDTSTGVPINFIPGVDKEVFAMKAIGTDVLLAGDFSTAGGTLRNGVAAIDTTDGSLLPFNPQVCSISGADAHASSIEHDGGYLYISGRFDGVNSGTLRDNIARVDATTGVVDGTWDVGDGGDIFSIEKVGGKLYASGTFSSIAGTSRNRVARFDLPGGGLDASWVPTVTIGNTSTKFLVDSGRVFMLGSVTQVDGIDRKCIGVVSEADGSIDPWNAGFDSCSRIADGFIENGKIYVAGLLDSAQGQERKGVAIFDLTTAALDPLNLGLTGTYSNYVNRLRPWNDKYILITYYGTTKVYNKTTGELNSAMPLLGEMISIEGNTLFGGAYNAPGFYDYYYFPIDIFTGLPH